MAKRFSPEFKQQAIVYALSNSHESVTAIAQKLRGGYSTLDKWIREANPIGSSKRQLSPEHEQYIAQDSRFRKRN
jgi:transposase